MLLQDRAGIGSGAFEQAANDVDAPRQRRRRASGNVFTTFSTGTPQLYVDVDRDKAQMLRRAAGGNIFDALQVYLGSAYVNDFNMFGRTFQVTAQADASFRMQPENIARISDAQRRRGRWCRSAPSSTSAMSTGPDRMPRYNLFPAAEVQRRDAAPGVSTGQALTPHGAARQARAARGHHLRVDRPVLPGEAKAGNTGYSSSRCRCCSSSWCWRRSTRAGRCRSPSS